MAEGPINERNCTLNTAFSWVTSKRDKITMAYLTRAFLAAQK